MVHHSSLLSSRTSSVPPSGSPLPCATYSLSRWPALPPSQPSAPTRSSVLHSKSAPRLYTTHQPSITQHLRSSTRLKCQLGCSHCRSRPHYTTPLSSSSREGQQPTAAQHLDQQSSSSTVLLNGLGQAHLLKLSSTVLTTPLHLHPLVKENTRARSHGHTGLAAVGGVCLRSGEAKDPVDRAATRPLREIKSVQQTRQTTAPSSSFHCLSRDDAPAAIIIDTICTTKPRDVKDGSATSHSLQQHHPVEPAQAGCASPPMTPIPTDSRFALDPSPSTTAAPLSSTGSADPLRSHAAPQAGARPCHGNNNSNSNSNAPCSSFQTWTQHIPIASTVLQAGASLSHGSGDNRTAQDVVCVPITVPTSGNEHVLNTQQRNKLGGRDSGIALELWDVPDHCPSYPTGVQLETERVDADHIIHQLLQQEAHGLALDGQPDQSTGRVDRRRRCQSMICASGRRRLQDSLSFSDDELVFRMDTNTSTSTAALSYETRSRTGRRVSISLGCDRKVCPRSPSLPPLQPTTGAGSVPRASFFCSPSDNDSEKDHSQGQPLHSTNSSFLSSSMPNSAALLLSKPPLPSSLPESTLAHGVPFSTMLDLATAKAENITGLYFARQMSLEATSAYSLMDPAETVSATQELDIDDPLDAVKINSPLTVHSGDVMFEEASSTRIKVSAASPVVRRERGLTNSGDSPNSSLDCTRLSCLQPAVPDAKPPPLPGMNNRHVAISKRSRAVTSSDTLVSSLLSSNIQDTVVDPSFKEEPGHVPGSHPAPPSAPARGHHRRSQSASHFFHLSSLKHHAPAQFNLALCYEHGQGGVERDLETALQFYQRAADQGHTKASYNIGCICYNLGEVSKAMAWFESAGKCSVRGLRAEPVEKSSSSSSDQARLPLLCPVPKNTSLPHELEDMLLGDMAATSGPFAAYLPAILCLALLCRQGVQNREGSVILERDREQAVDLLRRLLQRTSARSHLGTRGGNSQDTTNDIAGSGGRGTTHGDLRKRSSLDFQASARCPSTLVNPAIAPAALSTSCPSLPFGQWNMNSGAAHSSATYDPLVESLAVEEAQDGDRSCGQDMASGSGADSGRVNSTFFSAEPQGPDLQEAWSATLALQLLKAWTRHAVDGQGIVTTDLSLDQKILRHHLLYITNPTLGKNLYNLGVLYDIYLGEHLIAGRCYESAYRNSRPVVDATCRLHSTLVTRINSAWNLGVIHAKRQEWSQAKSWFLKAQQDVLLHSQRQSAQNVKDGGKDQVRCEKANAHASLVNVYPGNMRCLPNDSPEKVRAREHGLMMSFSSSDFSSKTSGSTGIGKCKRRLKKQRHCQAQDGLETDVSKVAWVLRWIDANMKSST